MVDPSYGETAKWITVCAGCPAYINRPYIPGLSDGMAFNFGGSRGVPVIARIQTGFDPRNEDSVQLPKCDQVLKWDDLGTPVTLKKDGCLYDVNSQFVAGHEPLNSLEI